MKNMLYGLAALLVLQLALAIGLNVTHAGLAGQPPEVALLNLAPGDISRVTISDSDGNSVTLAKAKDAWTLPDRGDFSADQEKVKTMIADLTAAKEGPAVATSKGADKRFKVAENTFERKVVLGPADRPQAVIYLGTAQGTQQVSVRRDGQQDVRRIAFHVYSAPAKTDSWIDRKILEIAPDKIASFAWGDVKLSRVAANADAKAADNGTDSTKSADAGWQMKLAGAASEPVGTDAVTALTGKLADLQITGLADSADKPKDLPTLDLTVTLTDGKTVDLALWKLGDAKYQVAATSAPWPVTLAKGPAEALISAVSDPAFQPPAPEPATTAAPADVTTPGTSGG